MPVVGGEQDQEAHSPDEGSSLYIPRNQASNNSHSTSQSMTTLKAPTIGDEIFANLTIGDTNALRLDFDSDFVDNVFDIAKARALGEDFSTKLANDRVVKSQELSRKLQVRVNDQATQILGLQNMVDEQATQIVRFQSIVHGFHELGDLVYEHTSLDHQIRAKKTKEMKQGEKQFGNVLRDHVPNTDGQSKTPGGLIATVYDKLTVLSESISIASANPETPRIISNASATLKLRNQLSGEEDVLSQPQSSIQILQDDLDDSKRTVRQLQAFNNALQEDKNEKTEINNRLLSSYMHLQDELEQRNATTSRVQMDPLGLGNGDNRQKMEDAALEEQQYSNDQLRKEIAMLQGKVASTEDKNAKLEQAMKEEKDQRELAEACILVVEKALTGALEVDPSHTVPEDLEDEIL
ncbi:hypothetical protein K491DRAFT_723624 [Lophiostoma macrostomum CBS 122681]|uniref:Uncharacterized protein n=1 Tax=Lophiostoma macrostomum CBS 122681 TaxID=1314788 RepID=A0A6A6SI25_9PLEO|nr:hypothetical protein K491DRAFT_723624 [Lophiostoma macrostomum CBS 122681]